MSIQYIEEVVRDRCNSYNPVPELDLVAGIDSVENGILLAGDLHRLFGMGWMALLKVCAAIDVEPKTF